MADAAGIRSAYLTGSRHGSIFLQILHRAFVSAYRDNAFGVAKGAAYSALLSFFPVFTTLTAILVQANAPAVSRALSRLVFRIVPPGTEDLVAQIFTERGHQPVYLFVFALLLSVWAASGVMLSLMEGFRAAYRIPAGRPFLRQRGIAALLVFSTALPIVTASALIVSGSRIEQWILTAAGVLSQGEQLRGPIRFATETLSTAVALAAIVLGTSLLYCIGPNPPRPLRAAFPGAMLATFLMWITTAVFGWYVRNIANYNLLYGSVGAPIALLVWMYLLSVIALVGCEYNAERQRWVEEERAERIR